MSVAATPLHAVQVLTAWRADVASLTVTAALAAAVWRAHRGGVGRAARWLTVATIVWFLATAGVLAVYAPVLFWVRAVQVQVLLLVVPFCLARAAPVTVWRELAGPRTRERLDRALGSRAALVALSPAVTSVAMLATPWLLYLTPWYPASLRSAALAQVTQIVLLTIGFAYFYARLQIDPVPRRYHQLLSVVITIVESIADGLLGLVLWLGPLVAVAYYSSLQRDWGPSLRTDQSIGAGILWLLGDVLGLPFLVALMRRLSAEERVRAREVDAELDRAAQQPPAAAAPDRAEPTGGLWWEADPQLRSRLRR
jgi:cytochrome c oxidase assembly factor CtaG